MACEEDVRNADGVEHLRYREHRLAGKMHVEEGKINLVPGEHLPCCLY